MTECWEWRGAGNDGVLSMKVAGKPGKACRTIEIDSCFHWQAPHLIQALTLATDATMTGFISDAV